MALNYIFRVLCLKKKIQFIDEWRDFFVTVNLKYKWIDSLREGMALANFCSSN